MKLHEAALLATLCLGVAGCSIPERGVAVPQVDTERALPLGLANARFFADADPRAMTEEGMRSVEREQAILRAAGTPANRLPPVTYLAVSGGGDNGAFGAGLLNGWTQTGTRPEFKMVTGVSTGALIAPFAFLGPDYDPALREVYTSMTAEKVYRARGLRAALFDDAMADTGPLAEIISRYADQKMLDAIAREYQKGRLLMIGTTDLDAQRPVIWNIGAIAASGHPGALELFRKILRASAAIPGAFQPVFIDVEIDGKKYQEMHVDGGAIAQLFLYPPSIDSRPAACGGNAPPTSSATPSSIRTMRRASGAPSRSPAAPSARCWPPAGATTCCAPTSSASATRSTTTLPISARISPRRSRASSTSPTCGRSTSTAIARRPAASLAQGAAGPGRGRRRPGH